MKKLLLFFSLVAVAQSSSAQVTFNPGLRAGASFSSISHTSSTSRTDFYIGAIGSLQLARFYTLQPEINYSRQGANDVLLTNYSYGGASQVYLTDVYLNYIGIGLINKFGTDRFHLQFGPGIDIIANENNNYNSTVDLTFTFGLDVELSKNFGIEGRFKKGMVDVLDSGFYSSGYQSSNNTNSVFTLGGYFKFN